MVEMIMSLDEAKKNIETINEKLGVFDIDKICPVGDEKSEDDKIYEKKVLQAVACGFVYWDDEKNCIAQKLAKKAVNGNLEADTLFYTEPIKMKMQSHLVKGEIEMLVARMTNRTAVLIGEIQAFDASVALAIVKSFFGE